MLWLYEKESAVRISEAATKVGLGATAIRFYEKRGVVPRPERSENGYRNYADEDVAILRFVRRARGLEIPLDDIREIVELRTKGQAPCNVVRAAMHTGASAIDSRIEELQGLRTELTHLLALADDIADDWPGGDCVCHIIEGESPQPRPKASS